MAESVAHKNKILAILPPADRKRLEAQADLVERTTGDRVYDQDERIKHVYFPISGVFSMVVDTEEKATVEISTTGNEGMLGTPVLLGVDHSASRVFCQIPGSALRMPVDSFVKKPIQSNGRLNALLYRYTQFLINQIGQSAACNRAHAIEQRCARWLLMTHDRVEADEFPLTQEFLAQMLGVRRASVTVVAGMLQKAGLIDYGRGHIRVFDRRGLEDSSCECYRVVRENYARLMGDSMAIDQGRASGNARKRSRARNQG